MDFQILTIFEWLTDEPDHFDSQLSERKTAGSRSELASNESISFLTLEHGRYPVKLTIIWLYAVHRFHRIQTSARKRSRPA